MQILVFFIGKPRCRPHLTCWLPPPCCRMRNSEDTIHTYWLFLLGHAVVMLTACMPLWLLCVFRSALLCSYDGCIYLLSLTNGTLLWRLSISGGDGISQPIQTRMHLSAPTSLPTSFSTTPHAVNMTSVKPVPIASSCA